MTRYRHLVLVVVVVGGGVAFGQDRESVEIGPAVLREISLILLPKVVGDCALLREYVRSEDFAGLRRSHGDLCGVDAIYQEALRLSWNNRAEALLIAAFASFDHRRVGVRMPLLGPLLWLPLTSEFEEDFDARVRSLPSKLYPDTPPDRAGDRDKLQHFFGSAFLAYIDGEDQPAHDIGDFVEWGEERFIVGGVNDERDKRSNAQGRRFALRLLEDESVLPSEFMMPVIVRQEPVPFSGCVPDSAYPVTEVQ